MEQSHNRIDFRHIYESILKVLNFEKGLLLTVKEMVLCPEKVIRTYLGGENRKVYTNPIQYVAILVGAYFFLFSLLPENLFDLAALQEGAYTGGYNMTGANTEIDEEQMKEAMEMGQTVSTFIFQYLNLITFLFIPITAIFTYLVYRKVKLYYPEHLVLNAYVTGTYTLLGILTFPLYFIDTSLAFLSSMGIFTYQFWAFMDVFKEKTFKGFFKASLVTILPFFLIIFVAAIVGYTFAYMKAQNGG
ncbi:MAG: DUF3667 domain-containing protein [Bacteroidota bacterium]